MSQSTLRVPFAVPPIRSPFGPPCSRFRASASPQARGFAAIIARRHTLSYADCTTASHKACALLALVVHNLPSNKSGAFGHITHRATRGRGARHLDQGLDRGAGV